jgi:2-methylcitrate dehydratase PrpD
MAKKGVTGPRRYLTGNKGFYRTFVEKSGIAAADFGDPEELRLHETWLKQYACCGCTHAYIDCVDIIDPNAEDIERVEARIQPKSDGIVGTANENLYAPSNIEEAQFNLPFEVALAILDHGNGFETHRKLISGDLALDDPELLETMKLIELDPAPSLGDQYDPKFVGDLTVHYEDGSSEHAFVEDATGTPDNPPKEAESREKFRELTLEILGEHGVEDLWNFVDEAGAESPIAEVTSLIH